MPAAINSRVLLDVASAAVERAWTDDVPPRREEIVSAVAELLAGQIASERSRCAEICRERAALWRRTPLAQAELPSAREEARARANEATYLADLIESGQRRAAPGDAGELN
jgi:hypothetical protein